MRALERPPHTWERSMPRLSGVGVWLLPPPAGPSR